MKLRLWHMVLASLMIDLLIIMLIWNAFSKHSILPGPTLPQKLPPIYISVFVPEKREVAPMKSDGRLPGFLEPNGKWGKVR